MGFYARPSGRLARQVGSDLFVLAWGAVWALVGRYVHSVINGLAAPAHALAGSASRMRDQLKKAAEDTSKLPAVGRELRKPFDDSAQGLADIARQATDQAHAIEAAAAVTGWLVFLIPLAIVVALWLPGRLRFFNNQRAAQRFIDSSADLDLFALRAMATQPMHRLASISNDPVAAWRRGDRAVIEQLAALELKAAGLSARGVRTGEERGAEPPAEALPGARAQLPTPPSGPRLPAPSASDHPAPSQDPRFPTGPTG